MNYCFNVRDYHNSIDVDLCWCDRDVVNSVIILPRVSFTWVNFCLVNTNNHEE